MATYLRDILPNRGLLLSMIEQKYIKVEEHPTEPLTIFNYTDRATYGKVWNEATQLCRGLIINRDYEVVARPFPKFFNHNEPNAPKITSDEEVYITDKVDGSLGITYYAPVAKQWCIATRGSFTSDQAVHATAKLRELEAGWDGIEWLRSDSDYTSLFEIVYPDNRIVLDYGQRDTLVYLGCVSKSTGKVMQPDEVDREWALGRGFECADIFPGATLADALTMPDRHNAEGIVVITADQPQRMVKIKQSDYLAMAKTMSNLSAKTIWERASQGESLKDIKFGMPEELWDFIETSYTELQASKLLIMGDAKAMFSSRTAMLDRDQGEHQWSRGDFAKATADYPNRDLLFLLLDNRDIEPVVWKKIKPVGEKPFKYRSEDAS